MKLHHYKGCALDNVYLENGYRIRKTPYGNSVFIEDVENLHEAIARVLIEKPLPLAGMEFRFLRQHINMSQKQCGWLLQLTEQAVAKWEKEDRVPRYADVLIRNYMREKLGGNAIVTQLLEQLAETDKQEYMKKLEFTKTMESWTARAA